MSIALDKRFTDIPELETNPSRAETALLSDMSDEILVLRTQGNDMEAFEELVYRYRNNVFALSWHFVRNREDAWDLSQDVFIKAYRGIRSFRGQSSFKTWLLRITVNTCKDFLKRKRLPTVSLEHLRQGYNKGDWGKTPIRQAEKRELGNAILEALEKISCKHKMAFILREFEGMSYEEMAEVMGCSIGTVMSRLYYARKQLRKLLREMGWESEL